MHGGFTRRADNTVMLREPIIPISSHKKRNICVRVVGIDEGES
jgi:hypothetical protein